MSLVVRAMLVCAVLGASAFAISLPQDTSRYAAPAFAKTPADAATVALARGVVSAFGREARPDGIVADARPSVDVAVDGLAPLRLIRPASADAPLQP